jgi:hypothetical protein
MKLISTSPMLPTDADKDVVAKNYRVRGGDYCLGIVSALTVTFISLLTNPVAFCLYPAYNDYWYGRVYQKNGHSKMGGAIIAAGPIFVVLISFIIFMCIDPRRNHLGKDMVPETCPVAEVVDVQASLGTLGRSACHAGVRYEYVPIMGQVNCTACACCEQAMPSN